MVTDKFGHEIVPGDLVVVCQCNSLHKGVITSIKVLSWIDYYKNPKTVTVVRVKSSQNKTLRTVTERICKMPL